MRYISLRYYERTIVVVSLLFISVSIQCVFSSNMYSLTNGQRTISQECVPKRQRQVDITVVSIVCDRQQISDGGGGDDYYSMNSEYNNNNNNDNDDGGYYINKPTCYAGDLGKVAVEFTIKNELPYNSTIYLSMRTYSYGRSALIRNRTDVCSYPNLSFIGKDGFVYDSSEIGSLCPLRSNVNYLLLTSFTIPELSKRDSYIEFTPDLILRFHSTEDVGSPLDWVCRNWYIGRIFHQ